MLHFVSMEYQSFSCKMECSETVMSDQKLNYKGEILLAVYFAFNKMLSGRDCTINTILLCRRPLSNIGLCADKKKMTLS